MLKELRLLGKMTKCFLTDQVIKNSDYQQEYNQVADTYTLWTDRMGKHVREILQPEFWPERDELRVLDLACGRGFISQQLLAMHPGMQIRGVDISQKMIEHCQQAISSEGANFLVADAIEFLETTEEKFDLIYCGWALPYLDHKRLLAGLQRVLSADGVVGIISNSKGTLAGVEEIFLDVMAEHVGQVEKIMDIRFKLPAGQKGLADWFGRADFTPVKMGTGEEIVSYPTPAALYNWLCQTGALAGTGQIFRETSEIREAIVKKLANRTERAGQYQMNHKFVYGIFTKGE